MVAGESPALTKPQFYSTLRLISLAQARTSRQYCLTCVPLITTMQQLNPWCHPAEKWRSIARSPSQVSLDWCGPSGATSTDGWAGNKSSGLHQLFLETQPWGAALNTTNIMHFQHMIAVTCSKGAILHDMTRSQQLQAASCSPNVNTQVWPRGNRVTVPQKVICIIHCLLELMSHASMSCLMDKKRD